MAQQFTNSILLSVPSLILLLKQNKFEVWPKELSSGCASCAVIKLWSSRRTGGAPWWAYWSAGITNTIGPAMGIEALKYISYPAQACFKLSPYIIVQPSHLFCGSLVLLNLVNRDFL